MTDDNYAISPEKSQAVFEEIKAHVIAKYKSAPQEQPKAIFVGGQPGAGKSNLTSLALDAAQGAIVVDSDLYRPFHPHYSDMMAVGPTKAFESARSDVNKWVQQMIDWAVENKHNVVLDGTQRDADVAGRQMSTFREAGFQVEAWAVATHQRNSLLGILHRFETQTKELPGQGRHVNVDFHNQAYNDIPQSFDQFEKRKCADAVKVFNRDLGVVYENELKDGEWEKPAGARAAMEAERARIPTPEERQQYCERWGEVRKMMLERDASPDEMAKVKAIYDSQKVQCAPEPSAPKAVETLKSPERPRLHMK